MANPFTYLQLHTSDPQRAKDFYSRLFDWKLDDTPIPSGTYTEILVGEGTGGGIMKSSSPDAPSNWLPFIAVDDVHESARRAGSLGAKVLVPPTQVPGKGSYSVVADPTGATFALWQKLS